MRIKELLQNINQHEPVTIQSGVSLLNAAELMSEKNIGALPVVDETQKLVGILSERDLVKAIVRTNMDFLNYTVASVMTSSVETCTNDDFCDVVYDKMNTLRFRHIPVTENAKLIAMLSIRDFESVYRTLREQSLTDELTGVHNMRHFLELLDNEFNRYRRFHSPLCLATIQLENLEQISGQHGASASDEALKTLANTLFGSTRAYDSTGRVSNDQFSVIFPSTEHGTAVRACERIMRTMADESAGKHIISIGLAFANEEHRDGKSLLKDSRILLQHALKKGGNRIELAPSAQLETRSRLTA